MAFDYKSLPRKYKAVTGIEYNPSNHSHISAFKNLVCIILDNRLEDDPLLSEVRDWCEDNFGDNWIYAWNKFYFADPKNAMLFSLRW